MPTATAQRSATKKPTAKKTAPAAPAADRATEESGEFRVVHLDPSLIVRDECNARETDTEPDEELLDSVRQVGVQDAISVRPRPDGTFGAFKGWRRAQAAQQANATARKDRRAPQKVPAHVRADLVGRDGWTRFLSTIENHNRRAMTEQDRYKAMELFLPEMSDAEQKKAAAALGLRRGAAKDAKRARRLDEATLRRGSAAGMDLEQAAQLADVKDIPYAEERLLEALAEDQAEGKGGRGHWDQEFALLSAEMADRSAREAAVAQLKEKGIALLGRAPYGVQDPSRPLTDLTTGLGNPLTEANHTGCPGHSARLDDEHRPVWHCADPKAHGHTVRPEAKGSKRKMGPEETAHRRRVIAGNRAWEAARAPRREFIGRLCRKSKLPDEARVFALRTLLTLPRCVATWAERDSAQGAIGFLGKKAASHQDLSALAQALPRTRDTDLLFALVADACEYDLREKKAWEHLDGRQAAWLLLLESLGAADGAYTLSEVENEAVARHRPKSRADQDN